MKNWVFLGLGFCTLGVAIGACGDETVEATGPTSGPTSGTSTGGDAGAGGETTGGTGGEGGTEAECPHTGPDVLDPSGLPVCDGCAGGARCLPNQLIPAESAGQLADCDADNKCVPDALIRTGGNFIPITCTSVAGAEGRCLSECIPAVADQKDLLPQDICAEFELCTPCFDPTDQTSTGACDLSCDPGPVEPPVMLPVCCDDVGLCVPSASIPPDQADALPVDSCPEDENDYKCVPEVFITDPNYSPPSCLTDIIIGGNKPGVCLPECLVTGFTGGFVGQSTCPDGEKCAPCETPITGGPTGACDL